MKPKKAEAKRAVPKAETAPIGTLKPHPKNYRTHPEDQLEHLVASLKEHGFYRHVVAARDGTILAGHGIVEAAKKLGMKHVPIIKVDIDADSPQALKILAGDNELTRFAMNDDRQLTELLRDIALRDSLLGTGYDEEDLAALVMITRPESEIQDFDAANEWIGMPEFVSGTAEQFIITLQCPSAKDREEVVAKLGLKNLHKMKQGKIWTGWYPEREQNDLSSLEWVDKKSNGKPPAKESR